MILNINLDDILNEFGTDLKRNQNVIKSILRILKNKKNLQKFEKSHLKDLDSLIRRIKAASKKNKYNKHNIECLIKLFVDPNTSK